MKTSHGTLQCYNGVVAVDAKHQVIVAAETDGQEPEHDLFEPMVEKVLDNLHITKKQQQQTTITADSGYHTKDTLAYIDENKLDAYVADPGFRTLELLRRSLSISSLRSGHSRDPRFKDYKKHKTNEQLKPKNKFKVSDFKVDIKKQTCVCPAGKSLWLKASSAKIKDYKFLQFQAYEADCPVCPLKTKCLRRQDQKTPRQLNIKLGTKTELKNSLIEKMKRKIDSVKGRYEYSKRLGTVEPVFGNINTMIGFKWFSLRGKAKVNAQWQFISMVHNMLKIHRYGWQE